MPRWQYSTVRGGFARRAGRLPLAKLESVRAWLTRVERKLDVTFHRDRPRVQSNVKGAAKLITAWLAQA